MARIRTIKPTLWESEKLGRLSVLARLNFVGLISLADDEGRGRGERRYLIGRLHPYAEDVEEIDFVQAIGELEQECLVAFYNVNKARYYALPGWKQHQYIEKWRTSDIPPVPSDHPMAPLFGGESFPSSSPTKTPPSLPGNGREGKGRDWKTTAPAAGDLVKGLAERLTKSPEQRSGDYSGHRLSKHLPGKFCRAHVDNLSLEDCAHAIAKLRPNKEDKAALEWRMSVKQEETAR
jgi:hypothetical protein